MPEESSESAGDRHDNDARREARRREERWWRGGLIAALVFLGLATLFNGIAYRRLARVQQRLAVAVIRQRNRRRQGFAGRPFPLPFPGGLPNYGRPGWGWHSWNPNEQEQQQKQVPSGQSTPSQ
jgi:hypothetical protein